MSDMYSTTPSTSRLAQGTKLNGIFEIERHIASGGMGEIYQGRAIETGDVVAIKVMRTDLADNAMALALFRKEASALHYIHHDAIVRYYIFSLDPESGRHYLAMEFVDGQPLSELLKQGPLPFEAVCHLQERLASGLDAAHRHGIVHRDLSPDNILIPGGDVGRAKIIDFGIARSTRTGDGTIIGSGFAGKFNYVSPEQLGLFGGDVSAKSDIYSLGLLLAECVSGQPINMGGSQLDVIEKRRVVPDLSAFDARLRPLLGEMLRPDPKDRPESMASVAKWRPETVEGGETSRRFEVARVAVTDNRKVLIWGLAAAALVVILGGIGFYISQPSSPTQVSDLTVRPPALNPDIGVDARRAEETRRTAAEELAKRRADETKQAASQAAAAASAKPLANDRPADPKDRIRQFVSSYDGGDCFFVAPVTVAEGNTTLEGYGGSATPFAVLDFEFKRVNGFEATVGYHAVTPPQCAAISFLSRLRSQHGAPPRLDISAGNLRSNGYVTGFVTDFGNRNVELLMVDHEGIVQSLTTLLRGTGDTKTFTINLKRGDAGPPKLQLVFALTTNRPLEALKPSQPSATEVGGADRVFARALDESLQTGQAIGISVKSFNLEK
jgi:serine/threonine protein kinase